MRIMVRLVGVAAATACAVGMTAAPAGARAPVAAPAGVRTAVATTAGPSRVKVLAKGLNGPFEIADGGRYLYVAENDSKQITRIDKRTGHKKVAVTGFGTAQPEGVAKVGQWLVIVTGGAEDTAKPSAAASVYIAHDGGKPRKITDLLAYELAHNPDGQTQFDKNGKAPDTLSNPYYVIADPTHRGLAIVADAGGNDLLRIGWNGKVTKAKALPLVRTGKICSGVTGNNTSDGKGCDPVPTGIAAGPHHTLYVSGLSGEIPGQGRIYVLDSRTWKIKRVISGLDAPTGVAVDRHHNVYASEVTYGAPADGPGPTTDPASIGRIVRIDACGHRRYAHVVQPTGLLISGHTFYSTAAALYGLFGLPNQGQIVKVEAAAFKRS